MRLDKYLVEEGYFESRNRANDAIKAGQVFVDGKKAKASAKVDEKSIVEVEDTNFQRRTYGIQQGNVPIGVTAVLQVENNGTVDRDSPLPLRPR